MEAMQTQRARKEAGAKQSAARAVRRVRRSLGVVALASTFLLTPVVATIGEQPAFAKEKKTAKKKPAARKRSTPPAVKKTASKKAPAPPPAPPPEEKPVQSDLVPAA